KLLATLSAAVDLRHSRQEAQNMRSRQQQLNADMDKPFTAFLSESPAMRQVFDTIDKVAATDANVLILGENGSGKELVARELFGHVKGAFTDAKSDRPGRFEIASGGTLFLDEIGNLSSPLQAKLLTVLQNREVVRLGANKNTSIDVRLICATNMPLYDMVQQATFRQDLVYRINTVEIHLP
ncbi:MAG: sigma-54 factor interaction domain-containing protein, partial [Candidatus Latescibacteria bacterium]|nr:sigma-54 factor interaction domain-containing protein [Candidatus Latescibacterota bacterium]